MAVLDGRIAAVGRLEGATAADTVDASGRVVAPGFVDMMGQASHPLAFHPPSAESKLRQGITTMLSGEGWSPAPRSERTAREFEEELDREVTWRTYDEYLTLLETEGVALNVVHTVGAGELRGMVIGEEDVEPTPDQMDRMERLVEEAMEDGAAHPRAFGSFPRVLARYVREEGILSLEEAVRRLSSLPAGVLGLEDRGTIRSGARADLVVFDPETVRDRATFEEPLLYAEGIDDVFVNGEPVIREGRVTGNLPGTLIRHSTPGD